MAAQEPLLLRLKLEPGKEIRYSSKAVSQMEMMGMDMGQTMEMTMKLTPTVDEKGFRVVATSSDVNVKVASGSPMEGQIDEIKRTIENTKVTTLYNDRGNALESKTDSDNPMVAAMASGATSAAGFVGLQYPENAVKVGDTWKVDIDFSKMMGPVGGDKKQLVPVEYKLSKVDGGVATIVAVIKGKVNMEAPTGQSIGMEIDSESTYLVDVATGVPNEVTTKVKNNLDFGLGQTVQTSSTTMKRLPGAPVAWLCG